MSATVRWKHEDEKQLTVRILEQAEAGVLFGRHLNGDLLTGRTGELGNVVGVAGLDGDVLAVLVALRHVIVCGVLLGRRRHLREGQFAGAGEGVGRGLELALLGEEELELASGIFGRGWDVEVGDGGDGTISGQVVLGAVAVFGIG